MRELSRYLTLGALVTHLLLGCCWHHVHNGPATSELACAAQTADHEDHDCDHEQPSGPSHQGHETCREARCVFVRAVNERFLQSLLSWGQALVLPSPLFDSAAESSLRCDAAPTAAPPLRLHLVHQVLLI